MTKREHHESIAQKLEQQKNSIINSLQDLHKTNEDMYEWDADNRDIIKELNEAWKHINNAIYILETESRREKLSKGI